MASAHTPDAVLHFECVYANKWYGGVARTAGRDERRFCASQGDAVLVVASLLFTPSNHGAV